jgi:hypothetical protein
MSLINEALKKAQRVRHDDSTDASGAGTSGSGIAKRGKARSANTMVLIGSGAIVLVVLSVVVTVYLINRPSKSVVPVKTAATPVVVEKSVSTATSADSPTPSVVPPALTLPKSEVPIEPTIVPPLATASTDVANAGKSPTENLTAIAPPSAPATATVPKPVSSSAAPSGPDERVAAFVDAVRVMGIRSSGAESRVLMNERVYRVNDIVDRTLGIRLVKVAADSLTFSDPNGVTYVKSF